MKLKTPRLATKAGKSRVGGAPMKGADSVEKSPQLEKIDSLIVESEQAESAGRAFMEPAALGKKKRGRPSNAEKAAKEEELKSDNGIPSPPPFADFTPACAMVFQLTSVWIVRSTNEPRLAILPDEIQALSGAWGAVCNRYLPDIFGQHAELVGACIVTGAVGMRIYTVAAQLVDEKKAHMYRESENARANRSQPTQAMTQ